MLEMTAFCIYRRSQTLSEVSAFASGKTVGYFLSNMSSYVKSCTWTRPHKSEWCRGVDKIKKGSKTLQLHIALLWSSKKSILPHGLRTRAIRRSFDELATFAASFRQIDRRLHLFCILQPVDKYRLWLTFCGVPTIFDVQ